MTFVKSPDGEQVSAVNSDGRTVGFIRKNRMGTHGHWHGWRHYTWCEQMGECIWACLNASDVFKDRPYVPYEYWTDAPPCFSNVKEFKEYYGGDQKYEHASTAGV